MFEPQRVLSSEEAESELRPKELQPHRKYPRIADDVVVETVKKYPLKMKSIFVKK